MKKRVFALATLLIIFVIFAAMFFGYQELTTLEPASPQQVEVSCEKDTPLPIESQNSVQTTGPSHTNEATTLPLITADMIGVEGMDRALFDGAVVFLGQQADDSEKLIIPYIGVFGQYESDGKINVVCHVGLEYFCYNEKKTALIWDGTIITYGRAVLTENDDGVYRCDAFTLVGDGAAEAKDLQEFCGPLTELPDEIYNGKKYVSTFPTPKEIKAMYTRATGLTIQ